MKSESSRESGGLLVQLKRELMPHQEAEESTFYKALSKNKDSHKLALKAAEEHHVAETVLKEMEKSPRDERWTAKVEVLEKLIREHIEEEESEAFAAARMLEDSEIDDILHNFQSRKLQMKSDMNKPSSTPEISAESTRSAHLADEDLGQMV